MAPTTRTMAQDRFAARGLREPPPRPKEKDSFSHFIKMAEESAQMERRILEGKAELEKPLEEDLPPAEFDVTEDVLADVVHDEEDPEKGKRLCLAMHRTNALRSECVFNFFGEHRNSVTPKVLPMPTKWLSNQPWSSSFRDQSTRDQAFLSGFAEKVFRSQKLPDELASWMIDQVCYGQTSILNDKYLHILNESPRSLEILLDKARVESLFTGLGADSQCLNQLQETVPSFEPHPAPERPVPSSLKWVCRLLQTVAPRLQMEASNHAFYILLHLCLDHSVNSDIDTHHAVQDTIEAILCGMSDSRKLESLLRNIVPLLLRRIRHPALQRNLVHNLPAKSPLAASFQRHLALSFLLYPNPLDVPLTSPKIPNLIHAYFDNSSELLITQDTDYVFLAARLALLDIAIGPGPFDVPYYPLTSPSTSQHDVSAISAPGPQSSEEKAFNREVDALAQRVKLLSNSIIETGVLSDLSRMDAKDASERLYHRLENAVRIGGKKVVNIFGDDDDALGVRKIHEFFRRA